MDHALVNCPACSVGELHILTEQINIPHFGDLVISTLTCSSCGYRSSDIIPVEVKNPKRYSIVIDTPEKTNVRVVRSGTSTVTIPEIGARIDPGPFSEGYVTNVEGVFRRILAILSQLQKDLGSEIQSNEIDQKYQRTGDLIDLMRKYINGDIPKGCSLTLVIEDPLGNSAIIAEEDDVVKEEELTEEEIGHLLGSWSEKN